ncbi:MAG: hypothetical protein WBB28_01640 [Crinalium sp.]
MPNPVTIDADEVSRYIQQLQSIISNCKERNYQLAKSIREGGEQEKDSKQLLAEVEAFLSETDTLLSQEEKNFSRVSSLIPIEIFSAANFTPDTTEAVEENNSEIVLAQSVSEEIAGQSLADNPVLGNEATPEQVEGDTEVQVEPEFEPTEVAEEVQVELTTEPITEVQVESELEPTEAAEEVQVEPESGATEVAAEAPDSE